jgi:hypothetical protein
MKIFKIILFVILISPCRNSIGQVSQFQPDKQGKYILQNKLNKCSGIDFNSYSNQLTAISEWVRKNNPVMNLPKGFDAAVSLSGNSCDKSAGTVDFGIQSRISLSFRYFYIENGASLTASDWAAHGTEIHINNPIKLISTQFTETGFQTDDPPGLKESLEKALTNLKKYYTAAPVIKEIAPGVRLYAHGGWFAGALLVSNPDRPDIWIPVTVKEIMDTKLAYYRVKQEIDSINYEKTLVKWAKLNFKPNQIMRPNQYDLMKKEYGNFTDEELNHPAYSDAQSGISTINARGEGRQVVRFNHACRDNTLPETAVQFISLEYRPATNVQLEEFIKSNQGLTDYVGLFYNNLPVEKMSVLIQSK